MGLLDFFRKTVSKDNVSPRPLILEIHSYLGIYDGNAHSISFSVVEGCTAAFSIDNGITWSTDVPALKNAGKISGLLKAIDRRKREDIRPFTIEVKPRSVVFKSGSAIKAYDGDPLTDNTISINGDGLVTGEEVDYEYSSKLTLPGKIPNSFKVLWKQESDSKNYACSFDFGELEIVDRKDKYIVFLRPEKREIQYDALSLHALELKNKEFQFNNHRYFIKGIHVLCEGKDVGEYTGVLEGHLVIEDESSNDVTEQFQCILAENTISIVPRHVVVVSDDAEKEYDGNPLIAETYEVLGDGWAEGDQIEVRFSRNTNCIGIWRNEFNIIYPSGISNNYRVKQEYGFLKIHGRKERFVLNVSLNSQIIIYDGKNVHNRVFDKIPCSYDGHKLSIEKLRVTYQGKNVGSYYPTIDSEEYRIFDANHSDVTRQYDLQFINSVLEILPRDIIFISGSSSKEYDGDSLCCNEISVMGDDFADNDGADFVFDGELKIPGRALNSFNVIWNEGTQPKNYNVKKEEGLLEITNRKVKEKIVLIPEKTMLVYNGCQSHDIGFLYKSFESNRHFYTVNGISLICEGKDAGNYYPRIVGDLVVLDEDNNDVTEQFDVSLEEVAIQILPRPVQIITESATQEYSGSALRCQELVIGKAGFVEGEDISYQFISEQVIPGTCVNAVSYQFRTNTNPDNYTIEELFGTLTVKNRKYKYNVEVVLPSVDITYDGKNEHFIDFPDSRYDVEGQIFVVTGLNYIFTGKNVGVYELERLVEPVVLDDCGRDVTDQFSVSITGEVAHIIPRKVKVISESGDKEYDGHILFKNEVKVLDDGWADGEEINYRFFRNDICIGAFKNRFEIEISSELQQNYVIEKEFGLLRIKNRTCRLPLEVKIDSLEKKYDGEVVHTVCYDELICCYDDQQLSVQNLCINYKGKNVGVYDPIVDDINLHILDANKSDVTTQYDIKLLGATLTIIPRKVNLISESSSKEYDGDPLCCPKVRMEGDGFVSGDTVEYCFETELKLPGTISNDFEINWLNTDSKNYEITKIPGALTVNNRSEKYKINLRLEKTEITYDGLFIHALPIQQREFMFDNHQYTVYGVRAECIGRKVGEYVVTLEGTPAVIDGESNFVTEQFEVDLIDKQITILPRKITLISESSSKEYDGDPLCCPEVRIEGDGFAPGDRVEYVFGTELKLPGTISNDFEINWLDAYRRNYEITKVLGALTVKSRSEKYKINLRLERTEITYDGLPMHVLPIQQSEFMFDGHRYMVQGVQAVCKGRNVGEYSVILEGTPVIIDRESNYVTEQFEVDLIDKQITILPRKITLISESSSKEYDGAPLCCPEVRMEGDGFAPGDRVEYVFGTEIKLPGTISNDFEINWLDAYRRNYEITKVLGALTVKNRSEKYKINLRLERTEITYDGLSTHVLPIQQSEFMFDGHCYTVQGVQAVCKGRNVGEYSVILEGIPVVIDRESNYVTEQFEVDLVDKQMRILPRKITLISESASKIFDGDPLSCKKMSIQGEGFVLDDEVSFEYAVDEIVTGTVSNKFNVSWKNVEDSKNYLIFKSFGILSVLAPDEPIKIKLRLKKTEFIYNGSSYELEFEQLWFEYRQHIYNIHGISAVYGSVDVGVYKAELVGDIHIESDNKEDVSLFFELSLENPDVSIMPREVLIVTGSMSRVYDGNPLVCEDIGFFKDGFIDGEGITYSFKNSQTRPGTCTNPIIYEFKEGTKASNYKISCIFGRLEVLNRIEKYKKTVNLPNIQIIYNGLDAYTITYDDQIIIENGHSYNVRNIVGKCRARDVGSYFVKILSDEIEIFDEENEVVTNQFDLSFKDVKASIVPRKLELISSSATKEYDGLPLSCPDIKIAGDGFVLGEGIEIEAAGVITVVGTCPNRCNISFKDNTQFSNYDFALSLGTLTVLPRKEKYNVEISGVSATFTYDGEIHTVEGFDNLDFDINGVPFTVEGIRCRVSGKEPDLYETVVEGCPIVRDADQNDVSDQFDINIRPGILTINPAPVTEPEPTNTEPKTINVDAIIASIEGRQKDTKSRRELREGFTDTKETHKNKPLTSAKKYLDPVAEVDKLAILKNRILKRFPKVNLLCEIEVDDREYDLLCFYIKKKIPEVVIKNNTEIDILLTFALVQIGIRQYQNNFWPQVAKIIEKNEKMQKERSVVTSIVGNTLSRLGKSYFSMGECVSNILMHSFIPDSRSSKFFDYLFTYYSIDLERDITGLTDEDLDALCDDMINPYSSRQQMLSNYIAMSVRAEREYCKKVLRAALDMIDCSFWQQKYNRSQMLKGRLLERFYLWKEESTFFKDSYNTARSRGETKERIRHFRSPHIIAKMGEAEFRLLLPSQMITNIDDLSESPDIRWVIVSDEQKEFVCSYEEGCSGYRTKAQYIEITSEELFSETVVLLFADNHFLRRFDLSEAEIRFFDKDGFWVKSDQLKEGSVFGYGRPNSEVVCSGLLAVREIGGLKFFEFNLQDSELISISNEGCYCVGTVPETGLLKQGSVDGVKVELNHNDEISIYNTPPVFVLDIEEEKVAGTAISVNGNITRMSDCKFIDVRIGKTDEKKYYFIDTVKIPGCRQGFNKLTVDIPNSIRNVHYEFFVLKDFIYSFPGAPYIFSDEGELRISRDKINGSLDLHLTNVMSTISFSMEDVTDGKLYLDAIDENATCRLIFDVPALFYSWDEQYWQYKKPENIWHADFSPVIYLKYPASRVSMGVMTSAPRNTISESVFEFRKRSSGIFVCDMTKLKSYFSVSTENSTKKVMETIVLLAGDHAYEFLTIIQRSHLLDVDLQYDYENGHFIGSLSILGFGSYTVDLLCEDEVIAEQVPVDNNRFQIEELLETAEYTVKVYEAEGTDDDFSFDEEVELIGEKSVSMTNPDDLNGGCVRIKSIEKGRKNHAFDTNYKYYFFFEEQIEGYAYRGIFVAQYHGTTNYASPAVIEIDDINNLNSVHLCRLLGEMQEDLCYDKKKQCITEQRVNDRNNGERIIILQFENTLWLTDFITPISRIEREGKFWIEKEQIRRRQIEERRNSFWKTEGVDGEEDLVGHLRTRYSPRSRRR